MANPWQADPTKYSKNGLGITDFNAPSDKRMINYGKANAFDVNKSYWDSYNKNIGDAYSNKAKDYTKNNNFDFDFKNTSVHDYDAGVWGNHKDTLNKNINNLNSFNNQADKGYVLDTSGGKNRAIGRSYMDGLKSTDWYKRTFLNAARGDKPEGLSGVDEFIWEQNNPDPRTQNVSSSDFLSSTFGFDKDYLKSIGIDKTTNGISYRAMDGTADTVLRTVGLDIDPYEKMKKGFMDSYYNNFEASGWDGVMNQTAASQFGNYLNSFGARNEQDAQIMAALGIDANFYGGNLDSVKFNADRYNTNESGINSSIDTYQSQLDKLLGIEEQYGTHRTSAEEQLAKLMDVAGKTDADVLHQQFQNLDNAFIEDKGGVESYFNDFYDQYNSFNSFADNMRGNAGSLEEQLNQLGIRDIDALREGRSSIDDYMDQINNFESDLTGLNSSELLNEFNDLLYQNTEDGRGGFQGLIDEWGMEDNKINTAREKLGSRDEQLAEMLAKLGIYNKDSLDLFQDNFDQLDKYRSDYDGEDKFTSKLDFDFSNEFGDIDSVMSDYMGKYDQRQSELDSLFMNDGTSLEDILSGTAENDLDGFTELNKLLNQNKNELGKFTGDDLADETSLFDGLFDTTDNATNNIFDQREGIESTLTDLLDKIRTDDFYSEDDLSDYRGLLSSNKDLIDYWGADGAKDEAGLLNEKITGESNRLIQEDKNVANYRQSQKEMILELMRKSGGKLEFNDLPFNDMSDAEIARLFMGTREKFDDPDKLNSIFSQIGGS